jgi:Tol biopolymer transport system component
MAGGPALDGETSLVSLHARFSVAVATCLAIIGTSGAHLPARAAVARVRPPVFAAVVDGNGRSHLVTGRLGGAATRVYTAHAGAFISDVGVSPNGRRIAFTLTTADSREQLDTIRTDGTGLRTLVNHTHGWFENPVWSSNGHTLFFGSVFSPSDPTASSYPRIWRVPADGSTRPTRIDGGSQARPTSRRPAGRWLAIDSNLPSTGLTYCAVMRVNGTHRHDVGPGNCSDATWRPGAPMLAFSQLINDGYQQAPTYQAGVVSVRTGNYHVIRNLQSPSQPGIATPLAWTRNGSAVYVELYGDGRHVHIYRIHPDGSHKTNVTPEIPQRRTQALSIQQP